MDNPFSLKGKNIIITGASSGIGQQCAISCSEMGANIVLIGRDEERLKETYNCLNTGNHLYFILDITKYDDMENVIGESVNKIGKISGFLHSAGKEITVPFNMMNPSLYEDLYAVNVISGLEFARIVSKKKYSEAFLSIIFIASVMGSFGDSAFSAYCSSKGAIINVTKSLAIELAQKQIRVNCISPGFIKDTAMSKNMIKNISEEKLLIQHPLGFGKTIDVANACIYLLSNASQWVTGTNLIVDGGYSA
jgi:NAD(P)-dependent dehydrogenase (short-subunit alcohol dehydrogenase family)